MVFRKGDLAVKHRISLNRLAIYEDAGIITAIRAGDEIAYSDADELRIAVIAKAEALDFTFDEILKLIDFWKQEAKHD